MITFKVLCDECKREVSTLDAIILHASCLNKNLDRVISCAILREEDNRSTQDFAEFLPKVSEAELMSDAL